MIVKSKDPNSGEVTSAKIPIYKGDDKISGKIDIRSRKRFDHMGIRVELIGQIEVAGDASQTSTFMSNGLDLEPAGVKNEDQSYNFSFVVFQKPYDSYYGSSVKLRYFIRVTIQQSKYRAPLIKEQDVGVLTTGGTDEPTTPINLEVGIDDYVNIKIDFPKNVFDLKEVIEGKISFLLVKLLIKKMELVIVRKEVVGSGERAVTVPEDVASYEIMDGCPIKEEEIPVRLFLAGIPDLTPTLTNVNNKFSVRYFMSISITDDMNRRYFKNSEVKFCRSE